uniref:AAA+ ATPase domain-containing protein n=1 Tax=viral metagenome TaxID=1070528 RepID=A0A6C0HZC6_9ZZZZ
MKKFIQYLDTYKENENIQSIEYISILDQININYLHYKLSSNQQIYNPLSNYSLWQNQHDYTFLFDQNISSLSKKPKEYKEINVEIQNIQDLLNIIETYPLDETIQYNIDINMLHSIHNELHELNDMIGLSAFKNQVIDQILYFIQNLHIGKIGDYKHTVLFGPPGTGKTEIAKLIGKMYAKLGILQNSTFQKVTRSDLIAGYLGQTAMKTQKVIEKSLGGVLFIDEAYSLADINQNDSFSRECIDTLCEALSEYKDNWMVIIAGYEDEIKQQLFKANPGLESRFIWRFTLDPYDSKEMFSIFKKKVEKNEWSFNSLDSTIGEKWFQLNKDSLPYFGRDIEALFTYTKIAHGRRIFGKGDEKKNLTLEDLEKGFDTFKRFSKNKKKESVIYSMYC